MKNLFYSCLARIDRLTTYCISYGILTTITEYYNENYISVPAILDNVFYLYVSPRRGRCVARCVPPVSRARRVVGEAWRDTKLPARAVAPIDERYQHLE